MNQLVRGVNTKTTSTEPARPNTESIYLENGKYTYNGPVWAKLSKTARTERVREGYGFGMHTEELAYLLHALGEDGTPSKHVIIGHGHRNGLVSPYAKGGASAASQPRRYKPKPRVAPNASPTSRVGGFNNIASAHATALVAKTAKANEEARACAAEKAQQDSAAQEEVALQAKLSGELVLGVVEDPTTAPTRRNQCMWYLGDPGTPSGRYCYGDVQRDAPSRKQYCAYHIRVGFTPSKPRNDTKPLRVRRR